MSTEFQWPETGEPVRLTRKEDGVVVTVGTRGTWFFEPSGRLRSACLGDVRLRRGVDNRMLALTDAPRILPHEESFPLLEDTYRTMDRLALDAPPEAKEILGPVSRINPARLREDARAFDRVYRRVPILPPDQYGAIYLQATTGCPTNRCTFCTLYRKRRFRIRPLGEFFFHLKEVIELFGSDIERRHSIFLGDSNALVIPFPELRARIKVTVTSLPDRDLFSFADAATHRHKTLDEMSHLRDLGLRRVTLGLETGDPELYEKLGKPGTLIDAVRTVELCHRAEIAVGLTVLVGLGGNRHFRRHLDETVEFLKWLNPGKHDLVYLSPIEVEPESEYGRWAAADPGRVTPAAELPEQVEAFREAIEPWARPRLVRVSDYEVGRFLY